MTAIGPDGSGFFEDPYPVRLSPQAADRSIVFSGTTQAVMSCAWPVTPRCFSLTPLTPHLGVLEAQISQAGAVFTNFQNLNAFQDDKGDWHAVLAIGVKKRGAPGGDYWTVLVHAHPTTVQGGMNGMPLSWTADTVLSGSFSKRVDGNYDGKFFEDTDGKLYLLYVKNFVPRPALRNGIVIQPMLSPRQPEPTGPTTLLMPGDRFGPLESEWYAGTKAKLVEAPFIAPIGGKYALIYSTGAFQHLGYKAGVAWSDTLVPAAGKHYRKVLQPDPRGVWGHPDRPEVRYLVQSQQQAWPDFTPNQAFGPGVASVVEGPRGGWTLFFAGYDAADRPTAAAPVADAKHRRPYFLRLRAAVPAGTSVATAADADLATWLQPETR